jgi:hypothetical protein
VDPHVAAALEQLRAALARTGGRRPILLEVIYSDGTVDRLSVPGALSSPTTPPPDTSPARQTGQTLPVEVNGGEVERAILDVLARAERPLKGSAIASRAGRRASSYFRETLTRLVRSGVLVKPPGGGYWLASRGAPPDA